MPIKLPLQAGHQRDAVQRVHRLVDGRRCRQLVGRRRRAIDAQLDASVSRLVGDAAANADGRQIRVILADAGAVAAAAAAVADDQRQQAVATGGVVVFHGGDIFCGVFS